jgi:hypothetical protein
MFTAFTLASDDDVDSLHRTISTPNPHHEQDVAVLLSRTYVFAAFGSPAITRGKGCSICQSQTALNLRWPETPSGPPHARSFLVLGMLLRDEEAFKNHFSNPPTKDIGFSLEHARCSRRKS